MPPPATVAPRTSERCHLILSHFRRYPHLQCKCLSTQNFHVAGGRWRWKATAYRSISHQKKELQQIIGSVLYEGRLLNSPSPNKELIFCVIPWVIVAWFWYYSTTPAFIMSSASSLRSRRRRIREEYEIHISIQVDIAAISVFWSSLLARVQDATCLFHKITMMVMRIRLSCESEFEK